MTLHVAPITDVEAINAVLRAAPIAPKIRHDGREPGYIDHPLASYWGAYIEDDLVGVFLAVRFSQWEIEAHAALLPSALANGRKLAALFLDAMFATPNVERVTGYVMDTLPSAGNFCLKLGFEYEGRRRAACRIAGTLRDVLIYGITRQDWALQQERA